MRLYTVSLLIFLCLLFVAGCASDQQPASDTPGQKAAPFVRDRSKSK